MQQTAIAEPPHRAGEDCRKGRMLDRQVDVLIRPSSRTSLRGGADNVFDMLIDDVINYGDSLLAIGKTCGLPIRACIVDCKANDHRARPSNWAIRHGCTYSPGPECPREYRRACSRGETRC